jgi:hypothetical protein
MSQHIKPLLYLWNVYPIVALFDHEVFVQVKCGVGRSEETPELDVGWVFPENDQQYMMRSWELRAFWRNLSIFKWDPLLTRWPSWAENEKQLSAG